MSKKKNKRINKAIVRLITVMIILGITIGGIVGTKYGRRLLYKGAAHYIHNAIENETQDESPEVVMTREDIFDDNEPVLNYLIFGVEEIAGDCNTDSMLIASVNWKDGDIKITSLMRDTYVDIPGFRKNKLNAAFARGGIDIFIQTIQSNYKIPINGYAYVNFESFQNVIDLIGGVSIELTKEEAYYLNTKNYISEQKNRCVSEGMNLLNGNQVLGYCRIRHVKTITNTHDDYGRTERQRRVLSAIFDKCKKKNIVDLITIVNKSLIQVKTDISEKEIEYILEAMLEKHTDEMQTYRIPVDGMFTDPKQYEGITYPLVLNWDENILKLYQFIYNDSEDEAQARLQEWNEK